MNGEYDALVLAKAGLERLDLCNGENYTVIPFDTDEFLPAPCQGIVAIESRKNSEVSKMLAEISDKIQCFRLKPKDRFCTASMPIVQLPSVQFQRLKTTG